MKQSVSQHAIVISVLVGLGGSAYATQPPDVVQSDAFSNTAMGAKALLNVIPSQYSGTGNTASGYWALIYNTTGAYNTADGSLALLSNTTGGSNAAFGDSTLLSNTTGSANTAAGSQALYWNTTGDYNTALGSQALDANTIGHDNTASGSEAMIFNISGNFNTASGSGALRYNTTGGDNTAAGYYALRDNTTGNFNTALGESALFSNLEGNKNTATGYLALTSNTTGSYNMASGYQALMSNTTGIRNTADGDWALYSNTVGSDNTASGQSALNNTTGSNNIGLGANAGHNVTSGSNNVEIGNEGQSSDGGTIRIGTSGLQTATYIAGIENAKVTGSAVYVTASGQLGVLASSERYKTEIAPMGAGTAKLQDLRPVTFHLKTEINGPMQYGLIAEEVAKVYPELVIRDEAGKIQGVRYDELAPMLLNEVQRQQRINADQAEQNHVQTAKIASLEQQLAGIQAALLDLQVKHELVAQR